MITAQNRALLHLKPQRHWGVSPIFSTFTSAQEREALRRALAVSPQAPDSRLNKKIATWCNEFLLKNADEIWTGDISPNGMFAQMLAGLGKK